MKIIQGLAVLIVALLATETPQAQLRFGIHAGADASPDAITVGAHASYRLGRSDVYLIPSVSYGFGSEQILGEEFNFQSYRGSIRAAYLIPLDRNNDLIFAPQAGPVIYHRTSSDCSNDPVCSVSPLELDPTNFGVNIGAGMRFAAFSITAMGGIGDIPDASVWLSLSL